MKIGVLTFHRSENYGAYLQAYSLVMALRKNFPESKIELIDYDSAAAQKYYFKLILKQGRRGGFLYYYKRHKAFANAIKNLPLSAEHCITDDMEKFKSFLYGKYDVVICGSDQIWKVDSFRGFPNAYWLPGDFGCRKLSYAASSRSKLSKINEETKKKLLHLLEDFYYIGVRDCISKNEIEKLSRKLKVEKNCDPTFLYEFGFTKGNSRQTVKKIYGIDNEFPNVGIMTKNEAIIKALNEVFANKVNIISIDIPHKGTYCNPSINPFEFAEIICGLDAMVTSFFHGLCFALKGNTFVCALEEKKSESRETSKILDLMDAIGCIENYYSQNMEDYAEIIARRVYTFIEKNESVDNSAIIQKLQETSKNFLAKIECLNGEVNYEKS